MPGHDEQHPPNKCFTDRRVTCQIYFTDGVDITFGKVKRNEDFGLIGTQGDLCGIDAEAQVTAVQIKGFNPLQITLEFFARVFVVAIQPGQPAGRSQFKHIPELFIGKGLVTHKIDLGYPGNCSLSDINQHFDLIAWQIFDFHINTGAVTALPDIFPLQRLADRIEGGALKNLTFGKVILFQAIQ